MADKAGNLWFGTGGAGITRYDGKSFTNYTMAQGLAGNVVFCIAEDKGRNLWIGTTSGISKYDGEKFTNYSTAQGLAGNFVTCILQDVKRNIWFATHDGGASKYDGKRFINYTTAQGLANNYVRCMIQDKEGNLWFGTEAGGASKYDGKNFVNYTTIQGLANNSVSSIAQDNEGNLWIGTYAGVSKYDGKKFTNYTKSDGLADNDISCVLQDKSGDLWFGTHTRGVSRYDGKQFRNYTKMGSLADNNVNSMMQDKSGNLWISSQGGGVSKYEGDAFTYYTTDQGLAANLVFGIVQEKPDNLWFGTYEGGVSKYDGKSFSNYTKTQGLPGNDIFSILPDKSGNIWFGSDKGAGVSKFDGRYFTHYTTAQGLVSNSVLCMMQDNLGNIWFGTRGSGVSMYNGNSFTNYSTTPGLAGNNVWSMLEDKAGNIWFATHGGGAVKFDGKGFTNYTTDQGLVGNEVTFMLQDKNGSLWFGTDGEGISKYDGNKFTNYTTDQGLSDDNIWEITEDTLRNIIWLATNQGLSGLKENPSSNEGKKIEFENFNKNTGYPVNDLSNGILFMDNKGIIWAGSGNGKLIRFDYAAVNKRNKLPLSLEIQNVKLNNENICWNNLLPTRRSTNSTDSLTLLNEMFISFGKKLSLKVLDSMHQKYRNIQLDGVTKFYPVPVHLLLPHKYNNITIDFVAIEPAMPKQVRYQYKLTGYDNDWSPLSNNSSAVFGNVKAGNYIFKLKALSPFGIWSEKEYAFQVLSPWWYTWWAYTLYAMLVQHRLKSNLRYRYASFKPYMLAGMVLYSFYRIRIRQIELGHSMQINIMVATQEEERKRISRDLHDEIGTKLSALKLFLSSLHEKAMNTGNEEIKSLAANSEKFVTEAMQDIRKLLLNLSPAVVEEFGYETAVEGLINKINETNQIHFNLVIFGLKERLKTKYELALYRITQELINNVLKHADAKIVSLQIGQRDEKIILMIEDDGRGFDMNAHKDGYGLHNLNERIKTMQGIMVIDSQNGKGTSILIEIPYNTDSV